MILEQADWQHTDISDSEESQNLEQLTQLAAKTGFLNRQKSKRTQEKFENI